MLTLADASYPSGLLAGRVRVGVEKGPRVSTSARFAGAFAGGALLNAGSWAFMMCVFGGAYAVARLMRWQWR